MATNCYLTPFHPICHLHAKCLCKSLLHYSSTSSDHLLPGLPLLYDPFIIPNTTGFSICHKYRKKTQTAGAYGPQGQHCSKIMKPPQRLPLQMAEHLSRAQPDSVANHITARSISDWRALT